MQTLTIGVPWIDRLMPEGLPLHTSTLISGPGGSGKPLIGDTFVAAWLRNGGSAVLISLQYPDTSFIYESLKTVANLDLNDYQQHVIFVALDVNAPDIVAEGNTLRANLVRPEIWEQTIEQACAAVPDAGPGILVFGSALNLLLFSPTYGDELLTRLAYILQHDKRRTYFFSVSTSAKKEQIAQLEKLADNLLMTRSEKKPFRLFMRVLRLKDVTFLTEEVSVPIPPQSLAHVREIAEHSRQRVIPQISRI